MFSLSSLVAQSSNETPPTNRKNPRGDDSGLIDLKALAAQVENPPAASALPHAPIFPFGAPEPEPAPAPEPRVEPVVTKSRKGPWLVAAVGAVLVSAMAIGAASARPKAEPMTLGEHVSSSFVAALKRATPPPAEVKTAPTPEKEATAPEKAKSTQKTSPIGRTDRPGEPKKPPVKVTEPPPKTKTLPLEVCDLMCQMRKATQK
jgi:hypothetical protein